MLLGTPPPLSYGRENRSGKVQTQEAFLSTFNKKNHQTLNYSNLYLLEIQKMQPKQTTDVNFTESLGFNP